MGFYAIQNILDPYSPFTSSPVKAPNASGDSLSAAVFIAGPRLPGLKISKSKETHLAPWRNIKSFSKRQKNQEILTCYYNGSLWEIKFLNHISWTSKELLAIDQEHPTTHNSLFVNEIWFKNYTSIDHHSFQMSETFNSFAFWQEFLMFFRVLRWLFCTV